MEDFKLGELIHEGKTKKVHQLSEHVVLTSKERITAGDDVKAHDLEGKAIISITTTCRVFKDLTDASAEKINSEIDDVFNDDDDSLNVEEIAWKKMMEEKRNDGLRDGISAGQEKGLQQGFDQGYSKGYRYNVSFAILRGILSSVEAFTGDSLGKEISDIKKQLATREKHVRQDNVQEEEFLVIKQKTLNVIENLSLPSLYSSVDGLNWQASSK